MATRAVLQTFEKYQKERVTFVTTVAEMAKNPQVRTGFASVYFLGAEGFMRRCNEHRILLLYSFT